MLNMIAGSVLPITAFIGVFFAFAATCILTSFLNDWLPRDMGREFAHNGKLSAGKPRGAGIIFISVFCIAALLFGEMSVEMFIYLVLVFVEMLTGFMDDAADEPGGVYKKGILAPEFTHSGYNAVWTDEKTDEWLMQVKDGIVCSCSRTGGKGGWQLFSVSRWNREDGKRLKRHLELEFEKKQNRQIYWDDVAMFCHFEEYELGIYPMQEGDLIEIDDFSELCDLDPSYCGYEAQGQEKSEEK